jgi:hypothetical protein
MVKSGMFEPILHYKNNKKIKNFTIVGERHSGTNWLEKTIKLRFEIPITWEYGFKHWLNFPPVNIARSEHTLFFCITRNIYNWINSFYLEPHHINGSLKHSLKNFVSKKWSRTQRELDYITNKPYNNIFHLRKSKIEYCYYFLPFFVDNIIYIKYEDLQNNMDKLIYFLSSIYNIDIVNCNRVSFLKENYRKKNFILTDYAISYINDHAYWKYENLLGYSKYFHSTVES